MGKFNVVLTTYEYVMKDKAVLSKVFIHTGLLLVLQDDVR